MERLNNDWEFVPQWTESFCGGEGEAQAVRLPHTVKEMPLHYADSRDYEMVSGYRRHVVLSRQQVSQRVFLQFDGAAHIATLFVNGQQIAEHRCGYTAFRAEITSAVRPGDNLICVKLDSTENPAVPPFGFLIDYLTFGGLYRDAWLDIRPQKMITDLFVQTPDLTHARVSWQANLSDGDAVLVEILDENGVVLASCTSGGSSATLSVPGVSPWTTDHPQLYICRAAVTENGVFGDCVQTTFGFRTAEFLSDGFYLNGERLFLRGLNRHQSYPFIGYAAPERLQREDARILKQELCCNAVRTSHYPQSPYFIDACDREGLLVFTEIPGWQHIGDETWQDQAVQNVAEMITQYRNHPSIVLWGVRINESLDCDLLYTRTNELAHRLDPSRQTSGVRYLLKSSLLEDVYAYNDFSHTGVNPGCRRKADVTPDMQKPFLISECNGHMFPTKMFDPWQKRQEHALRHARVLDDAMADGEHAGMFAWCMFDYSTHRDFGSGDRICYHGVLDAFRNPKLAAAVYASQGEKPILQVGSCMDIGDYSEGKVDIVYAFTNVDEVRLYKNGEYVAAFRPKGYRAMKHPPVLIDDMVGAQLESREGFEKDKAAAFRRILLSAGHYGFENLPKAEREFMDSTLALYRMSFDELYMLYGKYVGNWGGSVPTWRFDAVKDGKVVASSVKGPSASLHLEVIPTATSLYEGECYDMAAVRIRVLDEFNNPAPYAQLPVTLSLRGDAQLVGPQIITLEGGCAGTYIRTVGRAGEACLTVSAPQTKPVTVVFTVTD